MCLACQGAVLALSLALFFFLALSLSSTVFPAPSAGCPSSPGTLVLVAVDLPAQGLYQGADGTGRVQYQEKG